MMQEEVFEPKYGLFLWLGLAAISLMETFLIWYMFSTQDLSFELIIVLVFFGCLILLIPFVLIRRIIFEGQTFTVEKYLLPAKTIHYNDVTDIGNTQIKTRQGNISTQAIENSLELYSLLAKLISDGKINRYQIEYRLVGQENLKRNASILAGVISFIISFASFFFFPNEMRFFRDPRVSFLIILGPVYLLVYQLMKNKAENQ